MTAGRQVPPLFQPGAAITMIASGDLSRNSAGLVFARVFLGACTAGTVFTAHDGSRATVQLCDAFTARRGEEMALVGAVDRRFEADRRIAVVENQFVGRNVFTAATLIEARARWVMALELCGYGEPLLVASQSWQAPMLGCGNAPTDVRKARSRTAAAELALLLGRLQPLGEDESDAFCMLWWYLRHWLVLPLPAIASQKWRAEPKPKKLRAPRVKKSKAGDVAPT